MLKNKVTQTFTALGIATFATLSITTAHAGTLENLERERAEIIQTLLNPSISAEQRADKINTSKHRLVDMERMVLRDKTLEGKNTPEVRVAFQNYDLTFLAHSSIEKDVSMMDLWLEQMGITTNSVMNAHVGRQ
ncbi:hypothetical protein [Curvivirga aplysinae]|uniref:hypothetical protein n=1 Tax=Curvivirga aplysinae TaxID=2529852 RepID=UPI0012BCDB11|nr:hypothetical protein [Curvivirga aplysinae]MTI08617.1 hypothetical protein [Curvivirga aplysinae]